MGKGSALGVIALLIGLGGLGFGIFSYFTLNQTIVAVQTGSDVHHTYYDNNTALYTSPSEDSWYDIPNISILFQVEPGESVYFIFTCTAHLSPVSGVWLMHFQLNIDDTQISESSTTVGISTASVTYMDFSVALQYVGSTLSPGSHEVTVETMRECDGFIYHCYLIVQTYIP